MSGLVESRPGIGSAERVVHWQGRSGRVHPLVPLPFPAFTLSPGRIYLLAAGGRALWAGEMGELVAEAASRAAFRTALERADAAYAAEAPTEAIARLTLVWDLEVARAVEETAP